MELINPLKIDRPKQTTARTLIDPLRPAHSGQQTGRDSTTAGYELGNFDRCPDCGELMEQLLANDILSNVCIKHRVCLPVKDKQGE